MGCKLRKSDFRPSASYVDHFLYWDQILGGGLFSDVVWDDSINVTRALGEGASSNTNHRVCDEPAASNGSLFHTMY